MCDSSLEGTGSRRKAAGAISCGVWSQLRNELHLLWVFAVSLIQFLNILSLKKEKEKERSALKMDDHLRSVTQGVGVTQQLDVMTWIGGLSASVLGPAAVRYKDHP